MNLVEDEVDARAADLLPDKDAQIVTYCSNTACGNSQAVANRLARLGYTNVRKYAEGIQDWIERRSAGGDRSPEPEVTPAIAGSGPAPRSRRVALFSESANNSPP